MRKIGIMGGTFNPIHNGHITMAKKAYEQFGLDEVWFMPTKNPPHKENSEIVSDHHRAQMIIRAIKDIPYFSLSTLEYEREGKTYTKDTLEEVSKKYPEDYFYFIIGSDSLAYIETWMEAEKLLSMAHILSAPRYPSNPAEDTAKKLWLEKNFGADIQFIEMEPVVVASKDVRAMLCAGEDVSHLLPQTVVSYIRQNKLYGVGGNDGEI